MSLCVYAFFVCDSQTSPSGTIDQEQLKDVRTRASVFAGVAKVCLSFEFRAIAKRSTSSDGATLRLYRWAGLAYNKCSLTRTTTLLSAVSTT